MQLMVATFNNYQELVDKALMIEGKKQQIESHKRNYVKEICPRGNNKVIIYFLIS